MFSVAGNQSGLEECQGRRWCLHYCLVNIVFCVVERNTGFGAIGDLSLVRCGWCGTRMTKNWSVMTKLVVINQKLRYEISPLMGYQQYCKSISLSRILFRTFFPFCALFVSIGYIYSVDTINVVTFDEAPDTFNRFIYGSSWAVAVCRWRTYAP